MTAAGPGRTRRGGNEWPMGTESRRLERAVPGPVGAAPPTGVRVTYIVAPQDGGREETQAWLAPQEHSRATTLTSKSHHNGQFSKYICCLRLFLAIIYVFTLQRNKI